MLLSVQCVQDLLQQDLRILICFASRVASSVDGALWSYVRVVSDMVGCGPPPPDPRPP